MIAKKIQLFLGYFIQGLWNTKDLSLFLKDKEFDFAALSSVESYKNLTSSAICLPRAMSSCLLAESEDWSLFYYYWAPFMLIINHFNNFVTGRLRYCTSPRSTLSIQVFWGHLYPNFSSLGYLHPLTAWIPDQELPGATKISSVLISWGAKRPGLHWDIHHRAMILSVKLLSKKSCSWCLAEKIFLFSSVIKEQ